jgi:hypothetical protein
MYKDQIRRLEVIIEDQNKKINTISKELPVYKTLIELRSTNQQELLRLRRLQWIEEHENLGFYDR